MSLHAGPPQFVRMRIIAPATNAMGDGLTVLSATYHLNHRHGTVLAAVGVMVLSFDALLVRLAGASVADIAFWRGLFIALSLTLALRVHRGRWTWTALYQGGWPALALMIGFGIMQLCFVGAIANTNVANALVILAAAPMFAAAFSGLFLREWVPLRTWVAILVAMLGIVIVFGSSLGLGGALGDGIALLGAVTVGANFTLLRRSPTVSRVAALAGGGLVACMVVVGFAEPLGVGGYGMAVLGLMGLVQMPVATVLMAQATRYLPAAEVSLFFTGETILGTFWVWLVLNEQPPPMTVIGGSVVVATLAIHSWVALGRQRRH